MNNSQQILRDSLKKKWHRRRKKAHLEAAISDAWPPKPVEERGSDRRLDAEYGQGQFPTTLFTDSYFFIGRRQQCCPHCSPQVWNVLLHPPAINSDPFRWVHRETYYLYMIRVTCWDCDLVGKMLFFTCINPCGTILSSIWTGCTCF